MGSRTDRFGFVTFDNDSDDLSFHDHQAFVADRISMDRLLRIACEAHTHTGIRLSEIPPAPPELAVAPTGGSLPPNQPIYYKVAVVDMYGQERLASAPAVAYTAPQVLTPTAPTIAAAPGGTLPPGDYQYAVSAFVNDPDDETIMSNIATGSLVAPNATWSITCPPPPSGASGWNIYRKAPTEIGFARIFTIRPQMMPAQGLAHFDDTGSLKRGFHRSPLENTTNVTSSIVVGLAAPLEQHETVKIYRTFDSSDWEQSLVAWTPTMPYTDQGFPTFAGYPPDVSAGVGGAPKIRLGVDTTGTLPPGLMTPTQIPLFNMRGPVQVGHWPWQWINELDTFHLLGLRASLGRGSTPPEQPLRVTLEVRFANNPDQWIRYVDQDDEMIYVEIPSGQTSGTITLPPVTDPTVGLQPGDGLRVAVVQNGDNTDTLPADLSVAVIGAGVHGPADRSDWSS